MLSYRTVAIVECLPTKTVATIDVGYCRKYSNRTVVTVECLPTENVATV